MWSFLNTFGLAAYVIVTTVQSQVICAINERMDAIGQPRVVFRCGDGSGACTMPTPSDFYAFPIYGVDGYGHVPMADNMALIRQTLITFPGVAGAADLWFTQGAGGENTSPDAIMQDIGAPFPSALVWDNYAFWDYAIEYLHYLRWVRVGVAVEMRMAEGSTSGISGAVAYDINEGDYPLMTQYAWDNRNAKTDPITYNNTVGWWMRPVIPPNRNYRVDRKRIDMFRVDMYREYVSRVVCAEVLGNVITQQPIMGVGSTDEHFAPGPLSVSVNGQVLTCDNTYAMNNIPLTNGTPVTMSVTTPEPEVTPFWRNPDFPEFTPQAGADDSGSIFTLYDGAKWVDLTPALRYQ
jgi:hypothetical protein